MATQRRRGRGEGGVYQRADGRWCAAVDLGWHDGKRKRKVIYGRTRREVAEKLNLLLPQAAGGNIPVGTVPTVDAWLTSWLAECEHRVAPKTLTLYTNVANYYVRPALGNKRLDKVRAPDFTAMTKGLLDKGKSLRTAQVAHQVLGMALRAAVRQGVITSNPADRVTAPAPRRKALETVTAAEARKLLAAAAEDRYGALWTLALTSGARQGEILALRWADVDLEAGTIHIRQGKTRSARRTLPLTDVARDALAGMERGAPDALVFATRNGTPISARNVLRAWHAFGERTLGRRLSFHSLRHSAATLMLHQGVPLKVVSDVLGHAGIRITADTYVEALDALKADAARRMDGIFTAA